MKFNKIYRVNVGERFYKFTDHKGNNYFGKIENDEPCDWLCEIVEEEKVAGYDMRIHNNPDAKAWTDFFIKTVLELEDKSGENDRIRELVTDESYMIGWFANAMMAMSDSIKQEAVEEEKECEHKDSCVLIGVDEYECSRCNKTFFSDHAKPQLTPSLLKGWWRHRVNSNVSKIVEPLIGVDLELYMSNHGYVSKETLFREWQPISDIEVCDILNGEKK